MKLALIGLATLILGLAVDVPGLMIAGAVWIPAGLLTRVVFTRNAERGPAEPAYDGGTEPREPAVERPPGSPGFFVGTALLLLVAVPSLAIGLLGIGFSEADDAWRWIPIAVGALSGGIALISSLMYATGSGLNAAAEAIGVPEHPGTVTIEAVRETGTFINERPRLEFDLLVRPEDRPEYRVTKRATVPHTALGSINVGDGFEALIDLEKEKNIEIHWDAPLSGGDPRERLEQLEEMHRDGLITDAEHEAQRRRVLDSI